MKLQLKVLTNRPGLQTSFWTFDWIWRFSARNFIRLSKPFRCPLNARYVTKIELSARFCTEIMEKLQKYPNRDPQTILVSRLGSKAPSNVAAIRGYHTQNRHIRKVSSALLHCYCLLQYDFMWSAWFTCLSLLSQRQALWCRKIAPSSSLRCSLLLRWMTG